MIRRTLALSVAALLWVGAGSHFVAQTPAGPAFEVASVRPSSPNPDPGNPLSMIALMLPQPRGRFTATNTPLRMLIMTAFELKQDAQLVGGPPALMEALLADRFKLKTHTETRELPVYDLVLARSDGRLGPDMTPSKSDCPSSDEIAAQQGAALAKGDVASFMGKPGPCMITTDASGGPLNLLMRGDGQEIKQLVEQLSALAQKVGANVPAAAANIPQAEGSSLMTTLSEQLGLTLESTRDGVAVVVIDSVEAALST